MCVCMNTEGFLENLFHQCFILSHYIEILLESEVEGPFIKKKTVLKKSNLMHIYILKPNFLKQFGIFHDISYDAEIQVYFLFVVRKNLFNILTFLCL